MAKEISKKVSKTVAPKAAPAKTVERNALQTRRVAVGVVVSNKMQKTIVVRVDRRVRHELYGKYVNKSRKFKAHDETNQAKIGDYVSIVETRPLSKEKRWVLQKIVRRSGIAAELNVDV